MSSELPSQPTRPVRSRAYLFLPRLGLIALVAAMIVVVLVVSLQVRKNNPAASKKSSLETFACRPGPWGEVECKEYVFDMPDELLTREFLQRVPLTWYFPGYSSSQLSDLFRSAGVSERDFAALMASARMEVGGTGGYVLSPSEAFVVTLSPATRAKIYQVLALDERNARQIEPLRFPAEHMDAWFKGAKLSETTITLIKRLVYPHGRMMLLADLDVLLGEVKDPGEQMRMVKALTRTMAIQIMLHVPPGANVDELAAYWGAHGRAIEVRPLLAAEANSPTGGRIGGAFLMPNFARDHLFKYPTEPDWRKHTCYWSAMNFFNGTIDDGFEGLAYTGKEIDKDYHRIDKASARMGDLVLLQVSSTSVIHACVYIADNIVFTKNGPGRNEPWVFMRLNDVVDYYTSQAEPSAVFYRLNNPSGSTSSLSDWPSSGPGH
jgi:hypothetical protein